MGATTLKFLHTFHTTKWHHTQDPCPLCKEIPQSIYHTILECEITKKAWNELEITLYRIYEIPVSNEEKAVGIFEERPTEGLLLRNLLTFVLRQAISDSERECYYKSRDSLNVIKRTFRKILQEVVFQATLRGSNRNKGDFINKVLTHKVGQG